MKKIILFLSFISSISYAQECSNYFYLQSNKKIELGIIDKKGKPVGKQVYKVGEVVKTSAGLQAKVNSEMMNEKGKVLSGSSIDITCKNGILVMDMNVFVPQEQASQFKNTSAKADQVYLEYPGKMKIGEMLKDGKIVMNVENNAIAQKLTIEIFDRKVEEAEKITTPAGTWDTFKISQKTRITMETMGIPIKFNIEGFEWFKPGFGTVRSQTNMGSSEIISIE